MERSDKMYSNPAFERISPRSGRAPKFYVMPQPDDTHSLYVPLFEALGAVGFDERKHRVSYNIPTICWNVITDPVAHSQVVN